MKLVDVVIPCYKPDAKFLKLIKTLEGQTYPIHQIVVMNTEQKYFEQFIDGKNEWNAYHNVKVFHLSKYEFDHGKTRNEGVKKSSADYFLMMTDDAIPADEHLVEHLVEALEHNDQVAVAYGRQLAGEDSGVLEQYTRRFNYPETSRLKSRKDLPELGIKTYFCSNVCACYKRDIFDQLGGFIKHTIFNEDMIYAAKVIDNGYEIAYVADAMVYHSHKYTNMQQFKRNFDLAVSQADHPEIFKAVSSESEGIKMVKGAISYLRKQGESKKIPELILQSGFKYLGYKCGLQYKRLPKSVVQKCTMNRYYWK